MRIVTALALKTGLMELSTVGPGAITKLMDREHSGMPMETSILESGKMTKLVAMEYSPLKSQLMRDNGFKTSSMARG